MKVGTVAAQTSTIGIVVGNGVRVELDGHADAAQIRRVIEAVSRS